MVRNIRFKNTFLNYFLQDIFYPDVSMDEKNGQKIYLTHIVPVRCFNFKFWNIFQGSASLFGHFLREYFPPYMKIIQKIIKMPPGSFLLFRFL